MVDKRPLADERIGFDVALRGMRVDVSRGKASEAASAAIDKAEKDNSILGLEGVNVDSGMGKVTVVTTTGGMSPEAIASLASALESEFERAGITTKGVTVVPVVLSPGDKIRNSMSFR